VILAGLLPRNSSGRVLLSPWALEEKVLVKEFCLKNGRQTYGRDKVRGWRLDVSDEKMVSSFVEKTVEAFGRVGRTGQRSRIPNGGKAVEDNSYRDRPRGHSQGPFALT
jgi:NAD(P)-dependent dehydrogenase (short-subunit alcohol dehydrogenase family)